MKDDSDKVSAIGANLADMFGADAVVLVLIGGTMDGKRFSGGSLAVDPDADRAALAADLPKLLRQMANDAERDLKAPVQNVPHRHVAKGSGGGAS
jgi:hypothetical protein